MSPVSTPLEDDADVGVRASDPLHSRGVGHSAPDSPFMIRQPLLPLIRSRLIGNIEQVPAIVGGFVRPATETTTRRADPCR